MSKKKRELSTELKERIVLLNSRGFNNNKISKALEMHRSTVGRVLLKFERKGSVENNPRSGRPRVTDERGDRKLYRILKTNRRQSLGDITSTFNRNDLTNVSIRTV